MRKLAAAAALLIATACAQPPVRDDVTIDFSRDEDRVLVTAQTTFDERASTESRAAALSSTDAWSARFARVTPELEEVSYRKRHGVLERVTRSGRVRAEELQQLLADSNVTVHVAHGEGWRELALYPGTSNRASRDVQRDFNESLESWSADVATYIMAMQHLYTYLDKNPQRARYVFAAVLQEKESFVLDEEAPLVEAVQHSMDDIAARMDIEEASGAHLAEAAELIYNPFPARMHVTVPGDVLSSTGFTKELTIEPVNLLDAISALEGRWVSPDPLVMLLRDQSPTSDEMAKLPRRAESLLRADDIAAAVREQLARPKAYVVRWRE